MNVAFIHYHLKSGGVTTVIRQQVRALQDACDILVLTGEPTEATLPFDHAVVNGIGYDRTFPESLSAKEVAESLLSAIHNKWPGGCDILHVHNPLLAKNRMFQEILGRIQEKMPNLFLQIHDFAEDGRPAAYYASGDYPTDCHYGVINTRDYQLLQKAGLSNQGLHLIPNAVTPIAAADNKKIPVSDLILYPVRAIRRKNIGEAILLSLLFPKPMDLRITQPPNSLPDIPAYHGWKNFAGMHNLPVTFEAGTKEDFSTLVAESRLLITTSIAEGFGFAFLEPWTAGKMLWGRKLPDICNDFERRGILLGQLYEKLLVPIEWIDRKEYQQEWRIAIESNSRKFGISIEPDKIADAWLKMTGNEVIDVGLLDEKAQKQAIIRMLEYRSPSMKKLIGVNPFLETFEEAIGNDAAVEPNRRAITDAYSEKAMGKRLISIYESVMKKRVRQKINRAVLLSRFFDIRRFSLLKWGHYRG